MRPRAKAVQLIGQEPIDKLEGNGIGVSWLRPPQLLTVSDLAGLCGVTPKTVRNWARRGALRVITSPGGQQRFDAGETAAFLAQRGYAVPEELSDVQRG